MKDIIGKIKRTLRCQSRHLELNISQCVSSNWYDHVRFRQSLGYPLDYRNPQTLNAKLMWLNKYWLPQIKIDCTDKYKVHEYINSVGLGHILTPIIGVFSNVDEIDFESLPNTFALKCTHGCGQNIFCRDKSLLDWENTKETIRKWLLVDYSKVAGERHYHYIKPRVLIEELISNVPPMEYQFWCVHGEPDSCLVCRKNIDGSYDSWSYSLEGKRIRERFTENEEDINIPTQYSTMIEYAKILSSPFPFVRVDFYQIDNSIRLAELTFTGGGIILTHYKQSFLDRLNNKLQIK
jgi:hypothetical protein